MKEHRIPITCIHDTFDLICPVCGNVWYNSTTIINLFECTRCGIETTIKQDPKARSFTLELQGA